MSNAYKRSHGGHDYFGKNEGRGGRKDNKIRSALKGVASFDLLNEVAAEDARRRRQQERRQSCISS
jgi:hypothetical protein